MSVADCGHQTFNEHCPDCRDPNRARGGGSCAHGLKPGHCSVCAQSEVPGPCEHGCMDTYCLVPGCQHYYPEARATPMSLYVLRDTVKMLRKLGVTHYKCAEMELTLGPLPVDPSPPPQKEAPEDRATRKAEEADKDRVATFAASGHIAEDLRAKRGMDPRQ